MEREGKRNYRAINSAVIVPRLNISIEDLVVCICPAMLGNGVASVLSYASEQLGVFVITTGICATIALYLFTRSKRKEEIKQRGYSRSGVLRRYLAYLLGTPWLRCR